MILMAIGIPELLAGVDEYSAHAAARHVAAQLYRSRSEAAKRSAKVAWRFLQDADDYRYGAFLDGNGNGVLNADIAAGRDPRLLPDARLSSLFKARFALPPDVPMIDGGFSATPIRIASGTLLTYSPNGTATGGTLYIRGFKRAQYAVRIFGVTGRTRVFRYNRTTGEWKLL